MNSVNGFSIRPARDDEYDAIVSIKMESCRRFDEEYVALPFGREEFARHIAQGDVTVAVDGHSIPCGYSTAYTIESDLFLYHLFVSTARGQQGLGTFLLRSVMERARAENRRAITLCTAGNIPWNAPYYSRHGFVILKDEEMPSYLLKFLNEDREHFTPQNFPLVIQRPELLPRVAMERLML